MSFHLGKEPLRWSESGGWRRVIALFVGALLTGILVAHLEQFTSQLRELSPEVKVSCLDDRGMMN